MKTPLVGTAILLNRGNRFLVARRLSKHAYGVYGCPGGKLEFGESPLDCVQRELFEETQLKAIFIRFLSYVASTHYEEEDKHYITLWFKGQLDPEFYDKKPKVELSGKEPKTEPWEWKTLQELREVPLMSSTLEALRFIDKTSVLKHYQIQKDKNGECN